MKLLAIRAVMRIFSWITPRAAEFIAPMLAAIVWYSVPRLRRVTRLNLKAVYPDMDASQRKKIGRESMTNYVRGIFEAGMLWRLAGGEHDVCVVDHHIGVRTGLDHTLARVEIKELCGLGTDEAHGLLQR